MADGKLIVTSTSSDSVVTDYGRVDVEKAARLFDTHGWQKELERRGESPPNMVFVGNSARLVVRAWSTNVFDIDARLPSEKRLLGIFQRDKFYTFTCVPSVKAAEIVGVFATEALEAKHSFFATAARDRSGLLDYAVGLGLLSVEGHKELFSPFVFAKDVKGEISCTTFVSGSMKEAIELAEGNVYRRRRSLHVYAIVFKGCLTSDKHGIFAEAGVSAGADALFGFQGVTNTTEPRLVGDLEMLENRPSLLRRGSRTGRSTQERQRERQRGQNQSCSARDLRILTHPA